MKKKIIITAILLLLLSCSDNNVSHRHIFFRMDTVTEVTLSVHKSLNVKPVWRSIDSLLYAFERRFSVTGAESEVRIINERTVNALSISPELGEMLATGIAYGDTLSGAFDITVLPLKTLWGFCEECSGDELLPDSNQVNAALRYVDYRTVSINDTRDTIFFDSPYTRIDIGGIAKGYVLKQLEALLKNRGINNFVIAAGGDIIASGRKHDNAPWRVGVRHPRNHSELLTALSLEDGVLVTSGDYERFRIVDGNRYHHIFDPSVGYSCGQNQSLTILAKDPVRADILSTGLFCRNAEEILEFVNQRDDLECIVVDSAGKAHTSDGWGDI